MQHCASNYIHMPVLCSVHCTTIFLFIQFNHFIHFFDTKMSKNFTKTQTVLPLPSLPLLMFHNINSCMHMSNKIHIYIDMFVHVARARTSFKTLKSDASKTQKGAFLPWCTDFSTNALLGQKQYNFFVVFQLFQFHFIWNCFISFCSLCLHQFLQMYIIQTYAHTSDEKWYAWCYLVRKRA